MLNKIKILSFILGFFYCGGMVWYSDVFWGRSFWVILLLSSTGIALLITPLLSDSFLRVYYVRLLSILLILAGIGGSFFSIVDIVRSSGHWGDMSIVMLQHFAIIGVLSILGIRIIRLSKVKE